MAEESESLRLARSRSSERVHLPSAGVKKYSGLERKEHNQFERNSLQAHNIRRWASYGALGLALVLYLAGLFAIASMLGFLGNDRFTADMWHIATVVVMALFTVPTLLILAVLRSLTKSSETKDIITVHEQVGQFVLKFLEKLASK